MSIRARFFVAEITEQGYGGAGRGIGRVELRATSRKEGENKEFWEATPSGTITIHLSAKGADAFRWYQARLGQDVYVDFSDTPETQAGQRWSSEYVKTPVDGS